jgi:glycerate kinase
VRVLVAPDDFGGTLTAVEAAEAMGRGWISAAPWDQLDLAPLSDGGPGFVDVLAAALPTAERVTLTVEDPLARPVATSFLLDGTTAYVESAQACGLHLLRPEERDPTVTTTYGVGQLIAGAVAAGARRIVVGLGGSATNDGGAGLLAALGVRRLGPDGTRLPPGGGALRQVARLDGQPDPRLAEVELVAATDVDAPLLGRFGASQVFGPQKGASRADVVLLDDALTRWADALEQHRGVTVRDLPGAGAAGGLGAALFALGAVREPGIALVQRLVAVAGRLARAELVVTGEGTFDGSSLRGKVVSGIAASAAAEGLPCLVIAGQVAVGRREAAAAGIEATYAVADAVGVPAALARPAQELEALAARVAQEWSRRP